MTQPTEPPADTTAAIEMWARLLSAAEAHVNHGDYPAWNSLPAVLQDRHRKAAAWLMGRTIVPPEVIRAKHRAAVLDEAIKVVLGRVEAYEGMGQDAVDRNRERTAIAALLGRMAEEAR